MVDCLGHRTVVLSYCRVVVLSRCRTVTLSYCRVVVLSRCLTIIRDCSLVTLGNILYKYDQYRQYHSATV